MKITADIYHQLGEVLAVELTRVNPDKKEQAFLIEDPKLINFLGLEIHSIESTLVSLNIETARVEIGTY